ncbi:hypothetical protein IG631_24067 [Alternaria alternata]|nr:hypothetical protein IG631_24067 [Alternaria alternata]
MTARGLAIEVDSERHKTSARAEQEGWEAMTAAISAQAQLDESKHPQCRPSSTSCNHSIACSDCVATRLLTCIAPQSRSLYITALAHGSVALLRRYVITETPRGRKPYAHLDSTRSVGQLRGQRRLAPSVIG